MKKFIYWLIAGLSVLLILGINLIFNFSFGTVLDFLLAFAFLLAPTIAVGIVFTMVMPKKLYDPKNAIFKESPFEKNMYKNLQVKKWKDYVPQFLRVENIDEAKKENIDIQKPEYLEFFISETCRAEMVHFFYVAFVIVMFVLLLIINTSMALKFGIALVGDWFFFNLLSIIIQRYNRPRFQELLNKVNANKKPDESKPEAEKAEEPAEQKQEADNAEQPAPEVAEQPAEPEQPQAEQKDQPAGEDNK